MRIVFVRRPIGESVALIHRPDGVVVALPSYTRKHRIPHDLAHAVVERELGWATGIFGSVAAGAMFDNASVVAGRPRPDAARRSERILRANAGMLGRSELIGGMFHRTVEHRRVAEIGTEIRRAWALTDTGPCPYDEQRLVQVASTLDSLGTAWESVDELEFFWPDRLISPVPAPTRQREKVRPRH